MKRFPEALLKQLQKRQENAALRELPPTFSGIDFASNDYLGFAQSSKLFNAAHQFLIQNGYTSNGATGSRLLSGNHPLYSMAEQTIAHFHQSESALIFNSGYDANLGLFASVPQKGDFILYDELCHASIRDGIRLSHAKSYKFGHNDCEDLEELILRYQNQNATIYIATESVFSMDGDTPDLEKMVQLCERYNAYLIVDEAHALGVFGEKGEGVIQSQNLQDRVFARVMTFGKGLGCHGAAILGNQTLKDYLINFARSLIYTTGLSPHGLATIHIAYQQLLTDAPSRANLRSNINYFNQQKQLLGIHSLFVRSKSAIQCAIIPGNEKVRAIARNMQAQGFDVKPILSPTVPQGQERLRMCLHSFNSEREMKDILHLFLNLEGF
ncbi:MAG TPA: 8-amino-7-oxononanoate synthase [Flavobacterium sp.]|mgnify:FL=1|nr:8-amino-7-oxononanoate synthase [Flavobacterium sp.]